MSVLAAAVAVLIATGAAGAACAAIATVRRRYLVVTVRGSSMSPTFDDAERVLTRRTGGTDSPVRGEVVVLRAPGDAAKVSPLLVKRVAAAPGDEVPAEFLPVVPVPVVPPGHLLVRGDNNASADSRSFGLVDSRLVVGTVMTTAITPKKGKSCTSPED
ncbi:MAG TPA: S26 family signal peptidase [Streptosporangiaceae bacterium]|nr:S26 family signal peptidase [Streptosporangiaceae bacterium]